MTVCPNTSPLVVLAKIDRLELLAPQPLGGRRRLLGGSFRAMYELDDQMRRQLAQLPSNPALARVRKIEPRLDVDEAGQALLHFTVYVDLTGLEGPLSPEAQRLFLDVRSELRARLDPAGAYDVRPHVHFLTAA